MTIPKNHGYRLTYICEEEESAKWENPGLLYSSELESVAEKISKEWTYGNNKTDPRGYIHEFYFNDSGSFASITKKNSNSPPEIISITLINSKSPGTLEKIALKIGLHYDESEVQTD